MPPITALLHTRNDALRLGRALETLLPCAEILIVDHGSTDATRRIARAYGAHIVSAEENVTASRYADLARNEWVFCIQPGESISESLQASLFEWSAGATADGDVFSMFVREETSEGWVQMPAAEIRLIPRSWSRWHGPLPAQEASAIALEGELLRFALP